MNRSGRLSVALHLVAHLADRPGGPVTSEALAECVDTNPVVVRRTLAGLREAGLVTSNPGPGGGWTLARDARDLTVADVHAALGDRLLVAVEVAGADGGCPIERAVAGILHEVLDDAEAMLVTRLRRVTVADLRAQVRRRVPAPHASRGR